MRTLIDIPDDMAEALRQFGAKRKASRASLVREALGEYLARQKASDPQRAFGLWGKRAPDGLAYQKKLRSEW